MREKTCNKPQKEAGVQEAPQFHNHHAHTNHSFVRVMGGILLAVLFAFTAVAVSFSVTLSEQATRAFAGMYADGHVSGFSHEQMVDVALGVRAYSLGDDNPELPVGDDYRTNITPDALEHLLDVRAVFKGALVAIAVSLLLSGALGLLLYWRNERRFVGSALLAGGIIPLACVTVLGLIAVIDFNLFFTGLHTIFFADGTWTFPLGALMIEALPIPFWASMAVLWAVALVVVCVLLIIAGCLIKRARVKL